MENQIKNICDINEKPYGRKGIEEMLERMKKLDDDDQLPTKSDDESIA